MQAPKANSGNRIAELREAAGLLRSQLAGALSIDQSTLWRWEQGASIPDARKFALAAQLDTDVAYLMGWSDERQAA